MPPDPTQALGKAAPGIQLPKLSLQMIMCSSPHSEPLIASTAHTEAGQCGEPRTLDVDNCLSPQQQNFHNLLWSSPSLIPSGCWLVPQGILFWRFHAPCSSPSQILHVLPEEAETRVLPLIGQHRSRNWPR
ncbi:hypothetical protein A6R68_18495 [Neotoma lepida]|uniref:Uncharacterized protein n=1 Tax=Neotoma lepida TaxID=56216 RepID=A0A1A6HMY6_NEOLE|nr:hypothetical protein A6R68_18495 [Neotoma lepida]